MAPIAGDVHDDGVLTPLRAAAEAAAAARAGRVAATSALRAACVSCDASAAAAALAAGADAAAAPGVDGGDRRDTLAHVVARAPPPLVQLDADAAGALLRALRLSSADVNAHDAFGATPLHLAIRRGNTALAAALLEAGANADAETGGGTV